MQSIQAGKKDPDISKLGFLEHPASPAAPTSGSNRFVVAVSAFPLLGKLDFMMIVRRDALRL